MRNLKKILALVLAMVMTFSVMSVAGAFSDDEKFTADYNEAATVLEALGVFQGYPDGSFKPEQSITRAEAAALIYRIATGDTGDKNVALYNYQGKFTDVAKEHWAAGYINYCANAEYIRGTTATTFDPDANVTGYQVLAMILRVVGYDKNKEFTGNDWEIQVARIANDLQITKTIGVSLRDAAPRQIVAELLFRTLTNAKMVTYTPALGYQSALLLNGNNDTLGYKTFGLQSATGIVTANQATGSWCTVLSKGYVSDANDLYVAGDTGLDMIGHAAKIWYNAKANNAAYAILDKSTAETVLTEAGLAGKYIAGVSYISDNYGAFSKKLNTPNVSKYVVIDGGDAIIAVEQKAADIYAINNFATVPTVTLSVGKVSGSGADTSVYPQYVLTGFDKNTMGVHSDVIVTQIAGQEIYNLELIKNSVTGVVRYYDAQGNVTLSDGTVLAKSATKLYTSAGNIGITQQTGYNTLETYVFTLDGDGRYIGARPAGSDFLFATYAYYQVDNASLAQMSYYVTGVTADGQVVTKQITGSDYNGALITNAIPTLSTQSQLIADATKAGQDRSLKETVVSGTFNVRACNATHIGDIEKSGTGAFTTSDTAVIAKNTVAIGSKHNYFVDENTKFYFISGTAAQPQVQEIVGKTALLGSGDAYVLPADSVITASVLNYSVNTAANYHLDTVLVKAPYAANAAADLYYLYAGDANFYNPGITNGAGLTQIGVHANAKALSPIWVETTKVPTVGTNYRRFFTHTVNAQGVTTLTPVEKTTTTNANNVINAYYNAKINWAGTSDLYITDEVSGTIINKVASNAVIVDLRPGINSGEYLAGQGLLVEIDSVADLIAQAAEYTFTVDAAGSASGATIVYIKSSQIRDTYAQFDVTFAVAKANGTAMTPATDYYEITAGSDKVPYLGTISFVLTDKAAGAVVTANGVELETDLDGVTYTISGITANVAVNITLVSGNAKLDKVLVDGTSVTLPVGAAKAEEATSVKLGAEDAFTMVATAKDSTASVSIGSGTTVELAEANLKAGNTVTVTDTTALNGGFIVIKVTAASGNAKYYVYELAAAETPAE